MNQLVRLLSIARKQWLWMSLGIALGVVVIAANSLLMALSGWFIASMAVAGSSGLAFNFFFPSAGIRFLAIARTLGRYAERLVTHEATFRILAELRVWLFKRFAPLAPAGLEHYAGGDVAGRLRADVDALENLYLKVIAPLAVGGISIAAALGFLFWFSPLSALSLLLFLLLAGVALPLLVRRSAEVPGKNSARLSAELRNKVSEGLRGAEELILLGAAELQAAMVDEVSSQAIDEQERLGRIHGLSLAGMVVCSGCGVAAVLVSGSIQVVAHQIPPPHLVMLVLFAATVFEAAAQLPAALQSLPAAQESASRIFELADTPLPVPDTDASFTPPSDNGICFDNVAASYVPGTSVLRHISFIVPAGGSVVVTGVSGIGKSLLAELLLRFRDYEGNITVGGVEIRDLPKEQLLGMIAAVPQSPHLFNGTIRENILLGDPHADVHALQQVLDDTVLSGWISGLPLGLDTPIGVNGSEISGGEARRIALARALLKNSPILVLDEPTEGLDATTEHSVVARLNERRRNSGRITLLVISHRPACLELGDAVICLGSAEV